MNEEQRPLAVDSLKSETNAGVENSQEQTGLSESGEDTSVKDTQEQSEEAQESGERSEAESAVRFVGYIFGIPAATFAVVYAVISFMESKLFVSLAFALAFVYYGVLALLMAVAVIGGLYVAWKIFRYLDRYK